MDNNTGQKHYSLWGAAVFYIKVAMERPFDAIVPALCTGIGTVLVLFVPSLFALKVLDRITDGSIPINQLILPVVYITASMLAGEILWRIGVHYVNKLVTYQTQNLTERTFRDLLYRPISFHNNHFAGQLVTRTNRLTKNFDALYATFIFNIVDLFTTLVFVGIILIPKAPVVYFSFFIVIGT